MEEEIKIDMNAFGVFYYVEQRHNAQHSTIDHEQYTNIKSRVKPVERKHNIRLT